MIKWILKKKAIKELKEQRPLPLGRKEFDQWSDRIIQLADIPGATAESQKFALAEMVLHVKPTESFASYADFVHRLRKGAANQLAHSIFVELKKERDAKTNNEKVLADPNV